MVVFSGNGNKIRRLSAGLFGLVAMAAMAAMAGRAEAVPSYARQTGLACEACHTVFPQLTPFGRVFKASGYTLSNTSKVQDVDRMKHYLMTLSDVPPISVMGVVSTSSANKAADADSSKTSTDFPQQFSIFYAGAISDNVGAFVQVTYDDQSASFGMYNTDIRFADVTTLYDHSVIYGLSLNNRKTPGLRCPPTRAHSRHRRPPERRRALAPVPRQ